MAEHTIYDWGKDYGIPFLIPLLVWWLTWLYGAGRAEKQKELNELRDNLNLLISLICSNIILITQYRVSILRMIKDYSIANTNMDISIIFNNILYDDCLRKIDYTRYASCIEYSENFVGNVIEIQNLCNQIAFANTNHNNYLNAIMSSMEGEYGVNYLMNFIQNQINVFQDSLDLIDLCIIKSKGLLDEIKSIEKKVKKLKLDRIGCDDTSFFEKIKQEYEDRNKNEKINNG